MAINGLFTFEDLYAGHSPNYHRRPLPQISSSDTTNSISSILDIPTTTTTTTTIISTSYFARLALSTEIDSSTKLNKLADIISFTYFYWILVVLAILLSISLIIVFIFYCRTFIKNYRTRRGSLSSFYRRQTVNSRINTHNIYRQTIKPVVPRPPPPPLRKLLTPPCPSKSLKSLDDQLYRHDFDITNSPQIVRHDVFLKEPLSTFRSSTSNLSTVLNSRLSNRSSDPPLQVEQLYEAQRASMELNDEVQTDSLIIDIN